MRPCALVLEPAALRVVPLSPAPLSRWLVALAGAGRAGGSCRPAPASPRPACAASAPSLISLFSVCIDERVPGVLSGQGRRGRQPQDIDRTPLLSGPALPRARPAPPVCVHSPAGCRALAAPSRLV